MKCEEHCWHITHSWPSGMLERTCCWCGEVQQSSIKVVQEPGHGPHRQVFTNDIIWPDGEVAGKLI